MKKAIELLNLEYCRRLSTVLTLNPGYEIRGRNVVILTPLNHKAESEKLLEECEAIESAITILRGKRPDNNIRFAYNRLFLARLTEFLDEKLDQMEKLPYGPEFRKVVDDAATLSGALEILKNEIKDVEEKQNENN